MIQWTLKDAFRKAGWGNPHQVAVATGLSYPVATRLVEGEMVRVDFHTLDRLCVALACQPGDLLRHVEAKGEPKKR